MALLMTAGLCYAANLGELMKIARSQAAMQQVYRDETRSFDKVKKAIDNGSIEKGQTKDEIKDRYGEPVVSIFDYDTNREKWIYKPAKSSFFKGINAYLFFDKDGKLDEVKIRE